MRQALFNHVARWAAHDISVLVALTETEVADVSNVVTLDFAACELRGLLSRPEEDFAEAA